MNALPTFLRFDAVGLISFAIDGVILTLRLSPRAI